MPPGFHIAGAQEMIAANDELVTRDDAARTIEERTLARLHREWTTSSANECWPARRAVLPSIEEIRCAHELRLRLRECYRRQAMASNAPWCVGVD
jgi:hypothetical protein